MDAELKEYLDRMFMALTDQIAGLHERMDHLQGQMDGLERRMDAMHLEFSERFRALTDRVAELAA